MTHIHLIAAITAKNRGLGLGNELLFRIPADQKYFKDTTMGHPVIMGRKTFESIGRPLPGRVNLVVSRNKDLSHKGVVVCGDLKDALERAGKLDSDVFVIGGAQIYTQALPYADTLYLTVVDKVAEADAFFPNYSEFSQVVSEEKHDHNGIPFTFLVLKKP